MKVYEISSGYSTPSSALKAAHLSICANLNLGVVVYPVSEANGANMLSRDELTRRFFEDFAQFPSVLQEYQRFNPINNSDTIIQSLNKNYDVFNRLIQSMNGLLSSPSRNFMPQTDKSNGGTLKTVQTMSLIHYSNRLKKYH